jgi:predicted enzyme related to lactoylglutathione lyase
MPALSFTLAEITIDCADAATVARFWSALFDVEARELKEEPLASWFRLGPLTEGGPVINFQPVPEHKQGKTRIHLDVQTDDIDAAVRRVGDLGGRTLGEKHVYPEGSVIVMADVEGNEFCIVAPTS